MKIDQYFELEDDHTEVGTLDDPVDGGIWEWEECKGCSLKYSSHQYTSHHKASECGTMV